MEPESNLTEDRKDREEGFPKCGWERPTYNSCRNRHCPKCQTVAKQEWLEQRKSELLDVPYFHCVFTLPHELNPLILQNKEVMLGLLFRCVNETLTGFAKHPKWKLEGRPGFIGVLHTWNQELRDHFHLHIIIPAGVLRGKDFIRSPQARFLFPVRGLGNVFAAKYRDHLLRLPASSCRCLKKDRFQGLENPKSTPLSIPLRNLPPPIIGRNIKKTLAETPGYPYNPHK